MELSIYDIVVGPVVSNKAYRLQQSFKQIMFQVHTAANKTLVQEAINKLFNVEVKSVRIVVRKGKRKISRTRNVSYDNLKKIAIVTLKKGEINLFESFGQDKVVPEGVNKEALTAQAKD